MTRVLIIEILLMAVTGAVVFRLIWAASEKCRSAWAGVILLGTLILAFVPGHIDESLIRDFGGPKLSHYSLTPLEVNLLRCLGLVLGAGIAQRVVAKRRRLGLADKPPYDDFP